ncbi:MAG: hypothetical protein WDZ75_00870 [Candidatus Paceibacterota bacterium]
MIIDLVTKFTRKEDIIFITSNHETKKSDSSDIDIYCVANGKSLVELFYDKSVWTEIFIDNVADVHKKIKNVDEIAINFLCELPFVFGDRAIYTDLHDKAVLTKKNYRIPPKRKNLLRYRIKVLLSKFINSGTEDETQNKFIINTLSYPLIQLVLEDNNVFPSSPKRWISQLREKLPPSEFEIVKRFVLHQSSRDEIINVCEKYIKDIEPIHIKKNGDNNITFLS